MKIEILGVKIDALGFSDTLKELEKFVGSGKPHQIVTVNPEFVMAAQSDPKFKAIINDAELAVPDGGGLLWASRIISHDPSQHLKERVTGVDLIWEIAKRAEEKEWRIYLLGGRGEAATESAARLKKLYPKLQIVGAQNGGEATGLLAGKDIAIIEKIRAAKPHFLFVAFGAPKQDKFIAKFRERLNVPVMIGVGGAFDFISDRARRAPHWLRAVGLEWLWRLAMEPWRFKRIIDATIKFPLTVIFKR